MLFKPNKQIKYMELPVLFAILFVHAVPDNATKLTVTHTDRLTVEKA
jgi:hypothetical protein